MIFKIYFLILSLGKKIISLIILIFFLGIVYSNNLTGYNELVKQVNELISYKASIENLAYKISAAISGLIIVISFVGTKQIINLKKSLDIAQNKIDSINYIKKISLFKFLLDDYNEIMRRETIATKEEINLLQLKAKTIKYEFEKLNQENIFNTYKLNSYHFSIIADAYFELADYEKAKFFFDKAYILDNNNSRANYGIAFTLEAMANKEGNLIKYLRERLAHLTLAVKLEPLNVGFISDLGFLHIYAGNYNTATYLFKKAFNINKHKFVNYFKKYNDDDKYYSKYLQTKQGKEILSLISEVDSIIDFERINNIQNITFGI